MLEDVMPLTYLCMIFFDSSGINFLANYIVSGVMVEVF